MSEHPKLQAVHPFSPPINNLLFDKQTKLSKRAVFRFKIYAHKIVSSVTHNGRKEQIEINKSGVITSKTIDTKTRKTKDSHQFQYNSPEYIYMLNLIKKEIIELRAQDSLPPTFQRIIFDSPCLYKEQEKICQPTIARS